MVKVDRSVRVDLRTIGWSNQIMKYNIVKLTSGHVQENVAADGFVASTLLLTAGKG